MAPDVNPAVRLSGVRVERGGTPVVHGVDLTVAAGTWLGVVGANGSGKTSLLRALAGRLPFAGGSCLLGGLETGSDRAIRASRIGFAPPAEALPDALRAGEALEIVGGGIEQVRERLGPLRQALSIDDLLHRRIGECSSGMRQRIAIAAAFAEARELIVLDEPSTWLDPVAAFDLRAALRSMVDEGLTLVTALHDLGTLPAACDAGLVLADGRTAMTIDRSMLLDAAADPPAFERLVVDALRSRSGHRSGPQTGPIR